MSSDWRTSPKGFIYHKTAIIEQNAYIEQNAHIEQNAYIERNALIRRGDTYIQVLAVCEGYSKTLVKRGNVAWINAGCQKFTLADAVKHWADREDRRITRAVINEAVLIAKELGLDLE